MANITELKKILYVEDEADIQAIAQIALEAVGGFEVVMASGCNEALKALESFNPDLLLLDVMMPQIDGPATLQKIRKLPDFTQTPVIFMTARVMPDEIKVLRQQGALDVIAKPFDPMELANQIKQIWENA